jgi:hypothetical protein
VLVGETLAEPLAAMAPVQLSPPAVQEVVFVADQVNVVLLPEAMYDELADKVTTGVGATVTVSVA